MLARRMNISKPKKNKNKKEDMPSINQNNNIKFEIAKRKEALNADNKEYIKKYTKFSIFRSLFVYLIIFSEIIYQIIKKNNSIYSLTSAAFVVFLFILSLLLYSKKMKMKDSQSFIMKNFHSLKICLEIMAIECNFNISC